MRHRLALAISFVVAGVPLAVRAQTQIKPRVMIMVDTSGSMQEDFTGTNTGGDGSRFYKDSLITRDISVDFNLTPFLGAEVSPVTNMCTPVNNPPANEVYNGVNSRLFAAKAAVTNVLNGSGDVEWGLERYTLDTACFVGTHTLTPNAGGHPNLGAIPEAPGRCTLNSDCRNGKACDTATNECTCTTAATDCNFNGGTWACTGGHCKANAANACPAPWGRTGGGTNHCICDDNTDCGNGLCVNGVCNCTGACNASGCDAVNRACVNPCTANGQCAATSVCSGGNCGNLDDFFVQDCAVNGDCAFGQTCAGGKCTCAHDDDCVNFDPGSGFAVSQVCSGGTCGVDLNWCYYSANNGDVARETSHRGSGTGNCAARNLTRGSTSEGTCGTNVGTTNTAPCNSKQVCYLNSDCGSNNCVKVAATDPWGECQCANAGQCRNGDYICTGNRCVYNQECQSVGGTILVDPAAAGYTPSQILLYVNGREDLTAADPELRAAGTTPLAGAARTAMAWYNAVKNYSLVNGTSANCLAGTDNNPLCDPKILCRPYALVQMTDGADTCETAGPGGDTTEGPIAAAAGFVDATPSGARVPNRVYVIGLATTDAALQGILNATAKMGGTTQAAFANSQSDIEKALADIITSSVLVEKCNYIDDDCNNIVDDPFIDINNPCANGAVGHCAANGKFKCSTDQLSESCGPVSCRNGAGTSLTFVDATHMRLNGATGFTAADVNQFITIVSSRLPANRGTFQITATTVNSVTYNNASVGTASENFPAGFEIYCAQQTSCRGNGNGGPLTQAGNSLTLAGVVGFTGADVGDAITISGAANSANNGTFAITAQTGTTVTFTNPTGAPQAAGAITWAVDCRSPSCKRGTGANFTNKTAGTIDLVIPAGLITFTNGDNGKTITIRQAAQPGNVGDFTLTFISATTVRLANPNGAVENTGSVSWNLYCTNAESLFGCNNFDDDCNGIPDDCVQGVAGSCCSSNGCLPVELCNGLDDDCNGIIDDNPVDVGAACGNNVGDCSPGIVRCCNVDPSTNGGACPSPGPNDKPYCVGGNPGYPKPADLCDGTDDNCDGVSNGVAPRPCYDDPTASPNPFPPGLAGHGICQAGSQTCTTAPLGPGNPGCPSPWPAASPCPNPVAAFGACLNARGPQREVCNGVDDDCNDIPDDNVSDSWVGMPCCPTGNLSDCTNTNGGMGLGTRCQAGALACVGGGQVCMGGVSKSLEICDGIDNDCDGIIDDVPGLGATCTANGALNSGACHATFVCLVGSPGMCDGVPCPNGLTCEQTGTPSPEVCNGIDDDCNNVVDDPDEVAANDPALMMPCDVPAPPNDKPPCMAGTPFCINGAVQCMGAVTPQPNVCGQPATDCTGNPSMNCPPGSMCFMGNCVTVCGSGEFPCPGGFVCDRSQTPPLCVPDACATANCPPGSLCMIDSTGKAVCTDPCQGVTCPSGFRCDQGACVDDTCNTFGCPSGQVCIGNPPSCMSNPCSGVECDTSQYCDNGNCVPLCEVCMSGDRCVDGMCQADPCAGTRCSAGQVCAITGGVGMCVTNMCLGVTCGLNQVCCGGACNNDPCKTIQCPDGIVCAVDSTCNATCSAPMAAPKNQIVGAGGGGFSCSMSGHGNDSWLWPLLLLLALLWRGAGRRREVR